MSDTKQFHISDVLSISTGRLVSTRLIEGVYDVLNWMTGPENDGPLLAQAARMLEEVHA